MTLQLLINGTDFTAKWRVYESRWTQRGWQGESAQSEFILDDDNTILHADLAARKIVEVWEDASGSPVLMYRGRIANKTLGMSASQVHPDMRWTVFTEDSNIDLRGIRVDNMVRAEESDDTRVEALRVAFLNGAASTHDNKRPTTDIDGTMIGSGTPVTMFEETYQDTDPLGVLQRIVELSGRVFFVTLTDAGAMELYYGDTADMTYISDIALTDRGEADGADGIDLFAVYKGPNAGDHAGQDVMTGGAVRYGDGSYYEESNIGGAAATYDKWEETIFNDLVPNDTVAERFLQHHVSKRDESFTYFAVIDMRAQDAHRIRAGMMVDILRKRANRNTTGQARAVVVTHEPHAPDADGEAQYRVTMEIGRPQFTRAEPRVRRRVPRFPPTPSGSTPNYIDGAAEANDSADTELPVQVSGSDLFMLALIGPNSGDVTSVEWFQSTSGGAVAVDASPEAFTLIDAGPSTADHDIEAWGLLDPDPSTDVDSQVTALHPDGRNAGAVLMYENTNGASVAAVVRDSGFDDGTGTSPSVTLGGLTEGDIAVAALSYHHGGSGADDTNVTPPAGWTHRLHADKGPPASSTHDAGIDVVEMEVDSGGSVTATWTLSTSRQWSAMIVALKGSGGGGGTATEPIGSENDNGDSENMAHADHVHAHGNITAGGPYHEAADVTIADAGGLYTATTVEGALQEIGDTGTLTIEEEDGTPTGVFATLKVPNGRLTDNGDGSASVDFAASVHAHGTPSAGFRGVLLRRTTNFTTTNANTSIPDFDAVVYDTDTFYDAGDPERITIPADFDGLMMQFYGSALWATNTDNYTEMKLYRNGTAVEEPIAVTQHVPATSYNTGQIILSAPIQVATGDYFTLTLRTPANETALTYDDMSILFSAWLVGGGSGSPLSVREVGGSDIEDVAELEFDASDFIVTDEGGGVVSVALTASGGGTAVPTGVLLESGHAVPFTFDEILQESDGSDFLWASE